MTNITKVMIKARKEQVCQLCGKIIEPGEYYHRFTVKKSNIKVCQSKHTIKEQPRMVIEDDE